MWKTGLDKKILFPYNGKKKSKRSAKINKQK